jgi:hypothetical protein
MVMTAITSVASGSRSKIALSAYNKILREAHTVIVSKRLLSQYESKMNEEGVPTEYMLTFLQQQLEATGQLKKVSDNQANKNRVRAKLPSEDIFLAQIALAADPDNYDVYIISDERAIYVADAKLNKEHKIRAMSTSDYSAEYC